LKSIITMTNNLTDIIFDRLAINAFPVFKFKYVVRTHCFDVNTLL